jgi:hypothetical protein
MVPAIEPHMRDERRAALVLLGIAVASSAIVACEPRKAKPRASAGGTATTATAAPPAREGPSQVVVPLEVKGGKAALPAAKVAGTGESDLEREAREEANGAAAANTLVLGSKIPSAANVPWPEVPPSRAEALGSAFRPVTLAADALLELARKAPELARFGPDFALFAKEDVGRVTNVNGQAFQRLTFTTEPLLWQPKHGLLLLLVPYRGSKGSVLAAYWALEGGGHRLAAAFALKDEAVPMALVYESHKREELHWSACWNCPGGQGEVLVKEDGRVVIAQR